MKPPRVTSEGTSASETKIAPRRLTRRIAVKVVPRASRDEVVGMMGDAIKVKLRAPPVEGAANAALIEVLAAHFDIRPSEIRIVQGATSRRKIVEIPATHDSRGP
ncbi:MAG: DUF167 domain-containing protein [Verrucomicrobia bacterium]|nr:DUF167 domain-containing protein [Verrucomicrobiota bacterium]